MCIKIHTILQRYNTIYNCVLSLEQVIATVNCFLKTDLSDLELLLFGLIKLKMGLNGEGNKMIKSYWEHWEGNVTKCSVTFSIIQIH